jgi:hypothetical protein
MKAVQNSRGPKIRNGVLVCREGLGYIKAKDVEGIAIKATIRFLWKWAM